MHLDVFISWFQFFDHLIHNLNTWRSNNNIINMNIDTALFTIFPHVKYAASYGIVLNPILLIVSDILLYNNLALPSLRTHDFGLPWLGPRQPKEMIYHLPPPGRGGLPGLTTEGLLNRAAIRSGGQFLLPSHGDFIGPHSPTPIWDKSLGALGPDTCCSVWVRHIEVLDLCYTCAIWAHICYSFGV